MRKQFNGNIDKSFSEFNWTVMATALCDAVDLKTMMVVTYDRDSDDYKNCLEAVEVYSALFRKVVKKSRYPKPLEMLMEQRLKIFNKYASEPQLINAEQ